MLTESEGIELARLLRARERVKAERASSSEPAVVQIERVRDEMLAAFGDADFAAATADVAAQHETAS